MSKCDITSSASNNFCIIPGVVSIDWYHEIQPFVTAYVDGTTKLCRLSQNSNIITTKVHDNEITSLKWNPLGTMFATTSTDKTCKLWRHKTNNSIDLLHILHHSHEPVALEWSPLFSSDQKLLLAVGTAYGSISVWIVQENHETPAKLVMETQGHSYDPITCLSINPDGLFLASGSLKRPRGIVNIWSLNDGNLVHTVSGNGGIDVNGLTWINSYNLAIAFSRSKTINILEYKLKHYLENSALIAARSSLVKKGINCLRNASFFKALLLCLPKMLQEQHHMEKLNVQTGTQLMHSLYLKSLASVALLLDIHKTICYPVKPFNVKDDEILPEYQWLQTFSQAMKLARSLIKRSDYPIHLVDQKIDGDDKRIWTIKQDEQIMQWVSFKLLL